MFMKCSGELNLSIYTPHLTFSNFLYFSHQFCAPVKDAAGCTSENSASFLLFISYLSTEMIPRKKIVRKDFLIEGFFNWSHGSVNHFGRNFILQNKTNFESLFEYLEVNSRLQSFFLIRKLLNLCGEN